MHPATAQVLEHLTEIEHWPDAAIGEIGDPFRRLALYLVGDPDKVKPGEYMPSLSPLEDTGALGLDGPVGCFRIYMPLSPAASRAFEQSLSRKLYGTGKKKVSKRISKKASKLTPGGKR